MNSIFNPLNSLKVVLTVLDASGAILLYLPILLAESVPNAEQGAILKAVFDLVKSLQTANGTNDIAGSLYNGTNSGKVEFSVVAPDGTVLESFDPHFSATVPNEEVAAILAILASYAAGALEAAAVPAVPAVEVPAA